MIVGGSLGAKNLLFLCLCVGLLFWQGWSEVLIKYTGKYVKIYFIIKITFCYYWPITEYIGTIKTLNYYS